MTDQRQLHPSAGRTTVTASGVAKMAGVGRAAVSNWRRRHADFPLPVGGTAASPVFDAGAVEQWLQQQGKLHTASPEEWLWRHIESYTPAAQIGEALCVAGIYLLVESWRTPTGERDRRSDKGVKLPSPKQLLAKLRSRKTELAKLASSVMPPEWSSPLEAILLAAAQLGHRQDLGAAFEFLHAQYATSTRSLSGPDATPDAVAEIMLGITGLSAQIFDFTCGTGTILQVAAERALSKGTPISCFGQEVKPQHALTALLRLWFVYDQAVKAGVAGEAPTVHIGDSLLDDKFRELGADAVVANPPFGIHDWGHERLAYDPRWTFGLPPRTEPELAWVQHALSHLTPGKTAVVLMPPAAAARPAGRRIRGELVRRGALQAVIALPAGMLPPVAIGLQLWVLTRPAPDTPPVPRVLFVDSATTLANNSQPRAAHAASVRAIVERAWKAYVSQIDAHDEPGVYRIVPAVDVLNDDVDLTPRRYLPLADQSLDPGQTPARVRRFGDLVNKIRDGLPTVRAAQSASLRGAPTADIADLIRSGSLSIHRAINRVRGDESATERPVEVNVLTGLDVISGGPPTGTLRQVPDRLSTTRIEAGDILIPVVTREIVARVATAEQVGAELGLGVHAVRVDPDVLDPWFLAGVLSRSDNARVAGGVTKTSAGMIRIDVTRLTVPVLPIDIQRGYGNAFRKLAEFQTTLARAVEQGNRLARDIADGIATGALTVESS